jgi:photosystem II stability/assembly factor-like uncharacterized protein
MSRSPASPFPARAVTAFLVGFLLLAVAVRAAWEPIGPEAGAVRPAAIVGNDLYAFGDAGIWRSPDRGATWTCFHTHFYPIEIIPFGGRLFASSANQGILVSADRGATWKSLVDRVPRADSMPLHSAYRIHAMGRYLLAGTAYGIYRSGDSGATWKREDGIRLVPGEYSYLQIAGFVEQAGRLIASSDSGILISSDSGAAGSWKRVGNGMIGNILSLGRYLYAWGAPGIFRSQDQGSSWDTLPGPSEEFSLWSADPFLYLSNGSDSTFSRSADSGKTWVLLRKGGHFDELYPRGDSLWASAWGYGLEFSADGGRHFRDIPMRAGSFLIMGAAGDRILLPDFGAYEGRSGTWLRPAPLPGQPTLTQIAAEGDLVFGRGDNFSPTGPLFVSRDGGLSWNSTAPILGGRPDSSAFKMAAIHRGRLFVARSDGVYRSDDTGASWIRKRAYQGSTFRSTGFLCFSPAGNDFFLADTGGVFRTADEGDHWLPAKQGITGRIRLLAGTGDAVYAVGDAGLFRSLYRGDAWSLVNADRNELRNLVAYGSSFLATYDTDGVELSFDGGARWDRSNQGLSVSTAAVAMAIAGADAYVSIYGGSIWRSPINELFPVGLRPSPPPGPEADQGLRLIRGPAGLTAAFTLRRPGLVRLEAFDPQGRRLAVLAAGPMAPGPHAVPLGRWSRLSGVRYLRLSADGVNVFSFP